MPVSASSEFRAESRPEYVVDKRRQLEHDERADHNDQRESPAVALVCLAHVGSPSLPGLQGKDELAVENGERQKRTAQQHHKITCHRKTTD